MLAYERTEYIYCRHACMAWQARIAMSPRPKYTQERHQAPILYSRPYLAPKYCTPLLLT
jgi:hypothetical protein